jgi:hypothetical protein
VSVGFAIRQSPQTLLRQVFDARRKTDAEQMRYTEDQVRVYVDKSSFLLLFTQSSEGFAASIS